MKFDFEPNFVQSVLNFLQEAPVPHKFIDPMLKLIVAQSTDPRIQSLAYPPESKAEVSELQAQSEAKVLWGAGANPQEPTVGMERYWTETHRQSAAIGCTRMKCKACAGEIDLTTDDNYNADHSKVCCPSCKAVFFALE